MPAASLRNQVLVVIVVLIATGVVALFTHG